VYFNYSWAPKQQIHLIGRGRISFTIKWNDFGQEIVGSVTSLGSERDMIATALTHAGFNFQTRRSRNASRCTSRSAYGGSSSCGATVSPRLDSVGDPLSWVGGSVQMGPNPFFVWSGCGAAQNCAPPGEHRPVILVRPHVFDRATFVVPLHDAGRVELSPEVDDVIQRHRHSRRDNTMAVDVVDGIMESMLAGSCVRDAGWRASAEYQGSRDQYGWPPGEHLLGITLRRSHWDWLLAELERWKQYEAGPSTSAGLRTFLKEALGPE
jgi:hypothetical protein